MLNRPISTTRTAWFRRGFLGGILVCGALNALSYFVRSEGWGNLLGLTPRHAEALGFPLQVWQAGATYGGYYVYGPALLGNVVFAIGIALMCGVITRWQRARFNRLVDQFERTAASAQRERLRFTVRDLFAATALAALLAAGVHGARAGRPEVLGAIYLLGPWLLIAVALLPHGISWQQRVVILVPATFLLIWAALGAGALLRQPVEMDRVLLGIFVCWTSQSALAALVITLGLILAHWRKG